MNVAKNDIKPLSKLRLEVDAAFDHAMGEVNIALPILKNAARAGHAAVEEFSLDLPASRANLGIAIIRSAEKPIDDRLKMRA